MSRRLWKKCLVLLIAAILVSTAAFSFYYISSEAFHKCSDKNCQICEMIRLSESLVKKSVSDAAVIMAAAVAVFVSVLLMQKRDLFASESLITNKVRLNY